MVKGNSGNHFAVKAGNAQKAGSLQTLYDGPRPNKNYAPMRKQVRQFEELIRMNYCDLMPFNSSYL